jgi:hypothetical protein
MNLDEYSFTREKGTNGLFFKKRFLTEHNFIGQTANLTNKSKEQNKKLSSL